MSVANVNPAGASSRHALGVELERLHQTGDGREQHLELRNRVENRFLVLLQIAVVRQRLSLERRQQSGQVADQTTRLTARQFRDIRILLLRHDRRSRRPRVGKRDVAEFRCAPDDDLFRHAREVDTDHRKHERCLGRKITRRGCVDRVLGRAVELQFRCMASGSRPSEEPASAPEPYGDTAARTSKSRRRCTSCNNGCA